MATKLPNGLDTTRSCIKSYNTWAAVPCSGAAACCPALAELGDACLAEVLDVAAAEPTRNALVRM